jgi:NAD(P)H-quinone oxidoreductase subunit 5
MNFDQILQIVPKPSPFLIMMAIVGIGFLKHISIQALWRLFQLFSITALCFTVADAVFGLQQESRLGQFLAILVQWLGTVIIGFSSRYLEGEPNQRGYVAALAVVLASVQLMLLADHWLLLILAWVLVGMALQSLLCFYPERPFALLAAHKKRLADRLADLLLIIAMLLSWQEVGSGSLSALWLHVEKQGLSVPLQWAAVLLVGAVVLRTALLPVHGWLIQVMEAPTPVSALLHAGVVNLGCFVLIRFAPLLQQAVIARWLLLLTGLATAILAGMVMLTRISIKVRLAWSTVAQMGFMLLECAVGLYSLAALHMIGHSLYKANAFLAASSVVRNTRLQALQQQAVPVAASLWLAPVLSTGLVMGLVTGLASDAWPWWWSPVIGLAWAPLVWLPSVSQQGLTRLTAGVLSISGLTLAALAADLLPLGLHNAADEQLGLIAVPGMLILYVCQVLLQIRPQSLARWRRWSYAGFYLDEAFTRLALMKFWEVKKS